MGLVLLDFPVGRGESLCSRAELAVCVDDLMYGIVYALTGGGKYSDCLVSLPAWLMRCMNQLYVLSVLCGWAGVMPREVVLHCFVDEGSVGGSVDGINFGGRIA